MRSVRSLTDYHRCLRGFLEAYVYGLHDTDTDIYASNVVGVRQRALTNHFPVTRKELGEAIFAALARVYVSHSPPSGWDLNRYGEGFADFIAAQQHSGKGREVPWLIVARLAAIEYGILRMYYAHEGVCRELPPLSAALVVDDLPSVLATQHPYVVISAGCDLRYRLVLQRGELSILLRNTYSVADDDQEC